MYEKKRYVTIVTIIFVTFCEFVYIKYYYIYIIIFPLVCRYEFLIVTIVT